MIAIIILFIVTKYTYNKIIYVPTDYRSNNT